MEAGEPEAAIGQSIEIGRRNLAAKRADVREPQIVGDDDQEIGPSCLLRGGRGGEPDRSEQSDDGALDGHLGISWLLR